jgi:hypothetical protein
MAFSLDAKRLGQPRRALLAGPDQAIPLHRDGGPGEERLCFVVTPDPVASVVLK